MQKGDALLLKTYTVDFLTKRRVVNNGEVLMYYVEKGHLAIIDKEAYEVVQLEMERQEARQLDFEKLMTTYFRKEYMRTA